MLTYGIPPEFRGGVHHETANAIGSVPSLSGHAVAYRWRSLPRVRRHRASKPQGSSERVLPWQITMDQLIFAPLSHTHYWYEVGMLKVPVYLLCIPSIKHSRLKYRRTYVYSSRSFYQRYLVSSNTYKYGPWFSYCVCFVCVCVFFPFILDIKFVGRTSQGHTGGRSHKISHPPSFCGACLNFSREKDSAIPFPRRP